MTQANCDHDQAKNHAEMIMDMAMDMRDCVCFVKDPRPGTDTHIKIRLGSHSGQVSWLGTGKPSRGGEQLEFVQCPKVAPNVTIIYNKHIIHIIHIVHIIQVVGGIVGNKCPRYCLFGNTSISIITYFTVTFTNSKTTYFTITITTYQYQYKGRFPPLQKVNRL